MIAAVVGAAAAACLCGTAEAQSGAYPPRVLTVAVSDPTLGPYDPFSVTISGCEAGELVEFGFERSNRSTRCSAQGTAQSLAASTPRVAAATAGFFAPATDGRFVGSVTTPSDGASTSFTIDVVAETAAVAADGASAPFVSTVSPPASRVVIRLLLGFAAMASVLVGAWTVAQRRIMA